MKEYNDKHGRVIHAGDTLFNPHDQQGKHLVVTNGADLFLDDFDSSLRYYQTEEFWEIVDGERHANLHPVFRELVNVLTKKN